MPLRCCREWLRVCLASATLCGLVACGGHHGGTPLVTESQAASERAQCSFKAGTPPAQTLASTDPTGSKIPIDHVVLMMQENRSFDAFFSHLKIPGQTIEAASDTATNPDANGNPVQRFHWSAATASNGDANGKDYYCFSDTDHGWDQTHSEYDDGKLDGFVTTNNDDGNGKRSMGYYDQTDIPYYYALAQNFAISDEHFCSLLGPTWPNRIFYFAGTSFGLAYQAFPPTNDPSGKPYPNVFLELANAGVSWKVYFVDVASPIIFGDTYSQFPDNFVSIDQYYQDAKNGQLPSVAVVEGSDSGKGTAHLPDGSTITAVDEHPPQDVQLGQAFVASVVNALMASPEWPSSALFLTYDEHGGEYDHVVPPKACPPDNLPLQLGSMEKNQNGGFDRYGFRVPMFVVSPYARRGYVSHVVTDHTSILKFVETRFNLPTMTGRDANAWPMLDMFDFSHPNTSVPQLPAATVDAGQQMQCQMDYPPSSSGF